MLLHFDDATSLTGARLWRRDKLIILYGLHHTLELQCIAGPDNQPVDMESRNCTRWELTITPSLASPTMVLASASYSENIAVGDILSFDFSTATTEMYKYVAGNTTAPGVFQLLGYEGSEDVATVGIQFPVILRTTTVNPMPPDLPTAIMNEIQRAADSTTSAANATSSAVVDVTSMADAVTEMSSAIASDASDVSYALTSINSMKEDIDYSLSSATELLEDAISAGPVAESAADLALSYAEAASSYAVQANSAAADAMDAASMTDADMSNTSMYMVNASSHMDMASAFDSSALSAAISAASAMSGVSSMSSAITDEADNVESMSLAVSSLSYNIESIGRAVDGMGSSIMEAGSSIASEADRLDSYISSASELVSDAASQASSAISNAELASMYMDSSLDAASSSLDAAGSAMEEAASAYRAGQSAYSAAASAGSAESMAVLKAGAVAVMSADVSSMASEARSDTLAASSMAGAASSYADNASVQASAASSARDMASSYMDTASTAAAYAASDAVSAVQSQLDEAATSTARNASMASSAANVAVINAMSAARMSRGVADISSAVESISMTVGSGTVTIKQGGASKGSFNVNTQDDVTIDLDAGGGTGRAEWGHIGGVLSSQADLQSALDEKQPLIDGDHMIPYNYIESAPTVGAGKYTIMQGGVSKGVIDANATADSSIALDGAGISSVAWGDIQGDITSQADLSSALDAKQPLIDGKHKLPYSNISGTPDIPTALSQLSQDSTHRTVTDAEKTTWNNKSDFSGSYDDLTNKPTIPPEQVQADWSETDSASKAYILNKPSLDYIPTSQKGAANGVAPLDGNSLVPSDNLPALAPLPLHLNAAPTTSTVGVFGQHAIVDSTGKEYTCVAVTTADDVTTYTWCDVINAKGGEFKGNVIASIDNIGFAWRGDVAIGINATLNRVAKGSVSINGGYANTHYYTVAMGGGTHTGKNEQIVIGHNFTGDAVHGVVLGETKQQIGVGTDHTLFADGISQGITVIPAATTSYTLAEGCFSHAPAEASTYTFPVVTDTTRTHQIRLTLDFTTVQTYAFADSQGNAIAPLFTPTIAAGDVYEFRCEYSAVQSRWLIYPCKEGAVSDDYVMQAEVGAANGVASLNSAGKVPANELSLSTVYGTSSVNGTIVICKANNDNIDTRSSGSTPNAYRPIVPSNLNYAVTAALTDQYHITLTSEQQQTAQSVIGVPAPIIGTTAPTTSTVGVVGQLYVDTATSKTYHCTSVTNTGTEAEPVWSYTWTDDVNAMGGTFNAVNGIYVGGDIYFKQVYGVPTFSISFSGYQSVLVSGRNVTIGNDVDNDKVVITPQKYTSIYNGIGVRDGIEQILSTIPSATTQYTLQEGAANHIPSDASTYVLPTPEYYSIKALNREYYRDTSGDGTGYFRWNTGDGYVLYTATRYPTTSDYAYTNSSLTGQTAITAIDNRTHECILDVLFTGYSRSSSDDGTGYYAWKDTKGNLLYTATDSPTAGTTEAYTDTALSTSAGVIALYDSASSSIAMVGTYSFEDSAGNIITPLSTPTIKPGTIISFLCEWSSLDEGWTIMPLVTKEGL